MLGNMMDICFLVAFKFDIIIGVTIYHWFRPHLCSPPIIHRSLNHKLHMLYTIMAHTFFDSVDQEMAIAVIHP